MTRSLLAFALLGSAAGTLVAAEALAQAPSTTGTTGNTQSFGADLMRITYYSSDEHGDKQRRFTPQDFERFLNRARCQCNQQLIAEVVKQNVASPNPLLTLFVGHQCDRANTIVDRQLRPCVQLQSSNASVFRTTQTIEYSPVWLASGVVSDQQVELAMPARGCDEPLEQDAGLWICAENGSQTGCQADEFIINGTQSINSKEPKAIRVDFRPPNVGAIPVVEAHGGDRAVLVRWEQTSTSDIYGFRVLCSDENDQPLPGKGFELSEVYAPNRFEIYYTDRNLCGGVPFTPFPWDLPSETESTTGDDTTTSGGDTTTSGGDEMPEGGDEMLEGEDPDGSSRRTSLPLDWAAVPDPYDTTTGTTGDTTTGTTGDTTTGTTGDTTTGTTGDTTTGTTGLEGGGGEEGEPLPDFDETGIRSLDWAYVCSGVLSGTATSARIEGLENYKNYNFLLVAYDAAGNPAIVGEPIPAMPRETTDLWEQCEAQGGVCGDGGFCRVEPLGPEPTPPLSLTALGFLGLLARRRRRAAGVQGHRC